MIIQLLNHNTKSVLKSLINQFCDISRCNTLIKFIKNFIDNSFKNSTHKILILCRIEKMVWVGSLKSHFKCPKYTIKKVVLPGRVKCGGTEGEIVVAHGCRKRKKLICGMEGKIVVAHGRLPSPAPHSNFIKRRQVTLNS